MKAEGGETQTQRQHLVFAISATAHHHWFSQMDDIFVTFCGAIRCGFVEARLAADSFLDFGQDIFLNKFERACSAQNHRSLINAENLTNQS